MRLADGEVFHVMNKCRQNGPDRFSGEECMNGYRMMDAPRSAVRVKSNEKGVKRTERDFQNMFDEALQLLSLMVEIRDSHAGGHQRRVAQLAGAIAEELRLSSDEVWRLRMAGLLHDIGKVVVPIEILGKPGRLSETEFAIVRTHPRVGYQLLKQADFAGPIADAVLQHHERMDGSGYPLGLAGDDILLEARILGVADVVEAMCAHRPYRPALGTDRALTEIADQKGTLYDSNVVEACLRLFRERGFTFQPQPGMIRSQVSEPVAMRGHSGSPLSSAAR